MTDPLLNKCRSIDDFFWEQTILASIYSNVIAKEVVKKYLINFANNSFLYDVLNTVSISSVTKTLKIELVEKMKGHCNIHASACVLQNENRIIIANNNAFHLQKSLFMHELTHKAMLVLFQNTDAKPYKNIPQQQIYHKELKKVFFNVRDYIYEHYSLKVEIAESDSLQQIGKNLVEIYRFLQVTMYGLVIREHNFDLLDKHPEFDIYKNIPILADRNLFEVALLEIHNHRGDVIKKLFENNKKVDNIFLPDLLSTLRFIRQDHNIQLFKILLDIMPNESNVLSSLENLLSSAQYANQKAIASLLQDFIHKNYINLNDSTNVIPKIVICANSSNQKISAAERKNVMDAIGKILSYSIEAEYYKDSQQDAEVIANFAELITNSYYVGKAEEITKPLMDYCKTIIHDSFIDYQSKFFDLTC